MIVQIIGVEVSQSIQNMVHDIDLIAGKATMVRVYLGRGGKKPLTTLSGEIELPNQKAVLSSINAVTIFPHRPRNQNEKQSLGRKRRFVDESLCFYLKPDQVEVPNLRVKLSKLIDRETGQLVRFQPYEREFEIRPKATLRTRVIGLRVHDPRADRLIAPEQRAYGVIRSYVHRSFPISDLDWGARLIDPLPNVGPPYKSVQVMRESGGDETETWQNMVDLAHAQLMAVRALDVAAGHDHRALHYALLPTPEGGDYFVGSASDSPESIRPDVVAVGPARPDDGAYGAHEIGHILGLLHPGDTCQEQMRDDHTFPEDWESKLSNEKYDHQGLEIYGDNTLPRVRGRRTHWDVMTYCAWDQLWVSAHNYPKIYEKVRELEGYELGGSEGDPPHIHVVGRFNLKKDDDPRGHIEFCFPAAHGANPVTTENKDVTIQFLDARGGVLRELHPQGKRKESRALYKKMGSFHVSAPRPENLCSVRLLLKGRVIGQEVANGASPCPSVARVTRSEDPTVGLEIHLSWSKASTRRPARYAAQIENGDGLWETAACGFGVGDAVIRLEPETALLKTAPRMRLLNVLSVRETHDAIDVPPQPVQ